MASNSLDFRDNCYDISYGQYVSSVLMYYIIQSEPTSDETGALPNSNIRYRNSPAEERHTQLQELHLG